MKRTERLAFPVRRSEAPPEEPTTAIGYIRCSTNEQADSGLGLDAQRRRIVAYCTAKGFRLLDVFEDPGVSATSMDRPSYKAARAFMSSERASGRPVGVLVCAKMDRLSRVTRDFLAAVDEIENEGTSIAFVDGSFDTTTAQGRMMLTILAAMAQWERDTISERTSAALQELKASGRRMSRTPGWGFRPLKDGGLMVVPSELQVMETIFRLRFIEGYSCFAIAKWLGLKGFDGFYYSPRTGLHIARRLYPVYLTVLSPEVRAAAVRAGMTPEPLPVGSLLTYDANAILASSKDGETPVRAGPMTRRYAIAS